MSQRFRIRQVVYGDEVQVWILQRSAQHVAADSSEAINANFDCHVSSVQIYEGVIRFSRALSCKPTMLAGKGERRKRCSGYLTDCNPTHRILCAESLTSQVPRSQVAPASRRL